MIALCVALTGLPTLAAAESYGAPPVRDVVADQDIRVQRKGSAFSIDAVMHAPVPLATAWEVLTDFERMPRYQRSLKSSEVLERGAERLLVHQKGVARFGPFSSPFESVREMQLASQRSIRAQQVSGTTLKQMTSLMTLEPENGGTRLTYHAEMEPESGLPPLVGPSLVQHETAAQFSATVREMVRRQSERTAQSAP
ncbi:SRPBCC family protein [Ottowia testudinis]|uniref:SRPBCC family protein n=1 Tax=Ottowia testudinis TaxID=2816950 RepID=A0A975CFH8_9BURK|nr:SRPBCC family protein [Ottowia testudinis]QTD44826.1 SRPBCC family protein [Ottowia testudinis]